MRESHLKFTTFDIQENDEVLSKKSARFARKNISAPRARDLMVVALRAPIYLDFALNVARSIALSILM